MRKLTPGKTRGLQRCATETGALSILALDHRNNLRRSLNPSDPESVDFSDMVSFKQQVIEPLSPRASAVLLDPETGASQCISAGILPPQTGVLVAVDATGYTGDTNNRETSLLEGWSPAKVKKLGADAVKLLVYYHPDTRKAERIRDLVLQTAEECSSLDILFVVEPLSYSPDPSLPKLPSVQKRDVVVRTAADLTMDGVDILKAEFPLDPRETADEKAWALACAELTSASRVPWVLLSAGVSYETYLRHVTIACDAGSSGVAAGRAVWSEASTLAGRERSDFLKGTGGERMSRLTSLCNALGRPVWEKLAPVITEEGWYRTY